METQLLLWILCVLTVLSGALRWDGQACCGLTWTKSCMSACRRARSEADLLSSCGEEGDAFFQCVRRQEQSTQCCRPSASSHCRRTCRNVFRNERSPNSTQISGLTQSCETHVTDCVRSSTHVFARQQGQDELLECCALKRQDRRCHQTCVDAIRTSKHHELFEALQEGCTLNIMDPMVLCFMEQSAQVPETTADVGFNSPKRHCCERAQSTRCRQLCLQTFGEHFSTSWENFDTQCEHEPQEKEMILCLQEVDEPCRVGCSGLDYCTNFNTGYTGMFRRCDRTADQQARATFDLWRQGNISLPMGADIRVKDIGRCQPERWKAIACTLQMKPCQVRSSQLVPRICYSDCLLILSECLDTTRVFESPKTICQRLSAASDGSAPCFSLESYFNSRPSTSAVTPAKTCSPNTCPEGQICVTRKCRGRHHGTRPCQPYKCVPGCKLGKLPSSDMVPRGSLVRIAPMSGDDIGCDTICRCGHRGRLDKCHQAQCSQKRHCNLPHGWIEEHGSHFMKDCNTCVCHDGKVTCTQRSCDVTEENLTPADLPCNCPRRFSPVCSSSGQTFPNKCLANCLGVRDSALRDGSCHLLDACHGHRCASGETCQPRPQSCLQHGHCPMYTCVKRDCSMTDEYDPVCGRDQREYDNICHLVLKDKQLDHWGHCQVPCPDSRLACGLDSQTYSSSCVAATLRVPVNHLGPCYLAPLSPGDEGQCSSAVQCPPVAAPGLCQPIYLPGSCCPVCGAEVRILYSSTLLRDLPDKHRQHPSVQSVLLTLTRILDTPNCDILGYQTLEGDLALVLTPADLNATFPQVQACLHEGERLTNLINTRSPSLVSHAVLAPLLRADLRLPVTHNPAANFSSANSHSSFLSVAITLIVSACVMLAIR